MRHNHNVLVSKKFILTTTFFVILALATSLLWGWIGEFIGETVHLFSVISYNLFFIIISFIIFFAIIQGITKLSIEHHLTRTLYYYLKIYAVQLLLIIFLSVLISIVVYHFFTDVDAVKKHITEILTGISTDHTLEVSLSEVSMWKSGTSSIWENLLNSSIKERIPTSVFNAIVKDNYIFLFFVIAVVGLGMANLVKKRKTTLCYPFITQSFDVLFQFNTIISYAFPLAIYFLLVEFFNNFNIKLLTYFRYPFFIFLIVILITFIGALVIMTHITRQPLKLILVYYYQQILLALGTANPLVVIQPGIRMFHRLNPEDKELINITYVANYIFNSLTYICCYIILTLFFAKIFLGTITAIFVLKTVFISLLVGIFVATTFINVGALTLILYFLKLPVEPFIFLILSGELLLAPLLCVITVNINNGFQALLIWLERSRKEKNYVHFFEKAVPFRVTLVAILASLLIFSGAIIITISYKSSKNSNLFLTESLAEEMSNTIQSNIKNFLDNAEQTGDFFRFVISEDTQTYFDSKKTLTLLKDSINNAKEIDAVYWVDNNEQFTMVKRMNDGSISTRTVVQKDERIIDDWEHNNSNFDTLFPDTDNSLKDGYKPKGRVWYTKATEQKTAIWTDVYTFSSTQTPGITRAIPFYKSEKKEELLGVFGIDIELLSLATDMGNLDIRKKYKDLNIFILDEFKRLIAFSINDKNNAEDLKNYYNTIYRLNAPSNNRGEPIAISESSNPIMKKAYFSYLENYRTNTLYSFKLEKNRGEKTEGEEQDRRTYLALIEHIFPNELNWELGILVPQASILKSIDASNSALIIFSLVFIILAIIIGNKISIGIYEPLKHISEDMNKATHLLLTDKLEIESNIAEINTIYNSFLNLKSAIKSFSHYTPARVVSRLIEKGQVALIGGSERELTIFFTDIANFTSISENLTPAELVYELKEYLSSLSNIIEENFGTIDKYIGDAIMVFWGAPDIIENHAVLACQSALKCQEFLKKYNKERMQQNKPVFFTRIGINTGKVLVGNIGSDTRINYTIMGDAVNLASRLESLNKIYSTRIIISNFTYKLVEDHFDVRTLDKVAVQGKQTEVLIYELLGEKNSTPPDDVNCYNKYQHALSAWLKKDYALVKHNCKKALQFKNDDTPSQLLLEKAEALLKENLLDSERI